MSTIDHLPEKYQPGEEIESSQHEAGNRAARERIDERMISYLYCFNVQKDYFACHEYLESLWLDTGRPPLLKGLIQAAVCLYHLQGGNVRGGTRMWNRARGYLAPHFPVCHSIDLEALVADIDAVFARVPVRLNPQVVPAEEITKLQLPSVQLHVVDEEIRNLLSDWHLPVLNEDETNSET